MTAPQFTCIKGFGLAALFTHPHGVLGGASGGGIFWNGYHIANNWTLVEMIGADGTILRQMTTAALNSEAVAAY
jgi:hypothetical protein